MVAATFPNLSFENPPGTGPTVLSGNVEPFALDENDTLEVSFAGVSTLVVFLETDFVDISAATADEVAALLEARIVDLGAANDAGKVRLTSLLTGEDVELEVVGGSANFELAFPAGAVTGETYAGGPPDGWSVSSETDSVTEWADFADENTRPEEIFDGDGWVVVVVTEDLEDAIFDILTIPTPIETFTGWSPFGFVESTPLEAASFLPDVETFETFDKGWGSPTYFEFLPVHLLVAATIDPEDFELGWGDPADASDIGFDTTFANGTKISEDFEDTVLFTHLVTIVTAAAGEWVININGEIYNFVAAAENEATIASNLAGAINGGSVKADASAFAGIVQIFPRNKDTVLSVTASKPPGGTVENLSALDFPGLAEEWVGQDQNPDFD